LPGLCCPSCRDECPQRPPFFFFFGFVFPPLLYGNLCFCILSGPVVFLIPKRISQLSARSTLCLELVPRSAFFLSFCRSVDLEQLKPDFYQFSPFRPFSRFRGSRFVNSCPHLFFFPSCPVVPDQESYSGPPLFVASFPSFFLVAISSVQRYRMVSCPV